MIAISQAAKLIDSIVGYKTGPLVISVLILDVKAAYGSVRFQVTPSQGHGSIWVDSSSLLLGHYN